MENTSHLENVALAILRVNSSLVCNVCKYQLTCTFCNEHTPDKDCDTCTLVCIKCLKDELRPYFEDAMYK